MEYKHISVLLDECITGLNIQQNGVYVDGTVGGGGHSFEIASRLGSSGKLIGFDKDETALDVARGRLSVFGDKVKLVHCDFKEFARTLDDMGIDKVNGILLDLGVSSYQIDTADRGFSYIHDAPLDMRMDTTSPLTAYDVVNNYSESELIDLFQNYGEEKYTKRIARAIVSHRRIKPIKTTLELSKIIEDSVPAGGQGHPAKRVFQALRIEVNQELDNLYECILSMARRLVSGGRLCIISFHSLEDKIVKDAYNLLCSDCICDKKLPVCICNHKREAILVNKKPILAGESELKNNSRSHSAKLRILQKL